MRSYFIWLTIVFSAHSGCGGLPRVVPTASGGTGGATAWHPTPLGGVTSTGGAAMCEVGGTGSFIGGTVCMGDEPIETPPVASGDRAITVTPVDANSVCKGATCPVERVFNLSYEDYDLYMRLASNSETTWIVSQDARLLEVTQSGIVTRDLRLLIDRRAVAVDTTGALWIFGMTQCGISALRVRDGVYSSVTMPTGYINLSGKVWVNAIADYAFFQLGSDEFHQATWDGLCWTDQKLPLVSPRVALDVNGRPWNCNVAFENSGAEVTHQYTYTLSVHSLDGAGPDAQFSVAVDTSESFRFGDIVPGGSDGTILSVLYGLPSGTFMLSYNPSTSSHWTRQSISDSPLAEAISDCPASSCGGRTHCSSDVNGAGYSVAAVRTSSGNIYAAWLEYKSHTESDLEESTERVYTHSGVSYIPSCRTTATSGTGTVDLVIARLTEPSDSDASNGDTADSRARFRIYEGEAWGYVNRDTVLMSARGNTLAVALTQGLVGRVSTYLEIDSTKLP